MTQIFPKISKVFRCPVCDSSLARPRLLWQGIHVCSQGWCESCQSDVVSDLPHGHAYYEPYQIHRISRKIFGDQNLSLKWFGKVLRDSLEAPEGEAVKLEQRKHIKITRPVVLLNCVDYLYGHSLLKLLNAEALLQEGSKQVIVIIPKFLQWFVPKGVAEVWTVPLTLGQMRRYWPDLEARIVKELPRLKQVFLAEAYSHPLIQKISFFTGVSPHNWQAKKYRITFVYREDRPWFFSSSLVFLAKKIGLIGVLNTWQYYKIILLFLFLRSFLPDAQLTVAGLGTQFLFPSWIDDQRVEQFTSDREKKLCQVYAESRVAIGVHGSNMLLPSAHAGSTIDFLLPERMANFAQDILFQPCDQDPRLLAWRYRFLPISTSVWTIARTVRSMVEDSARVEQLFTNKG